MTKGYPLDSVLAIDCGSVLTKAILIDIVEGRYRLIAQGEALSTSRPPHANTMLGVARAITEVEQITGRNLLDQNAHVIVPERGDGSGIDALVAVASAGSPLRLLLVGLADEVSLESARQAILGCNAQVVESLSLEDGIDRPEGVATALNRFEDARPDVVLLVGGIDGSVSTRLLDLVSIIALAYQVTDFQIRPPVVYAGNSDIRGEIERILADLCVVKIVDNIRPSMELENPAPLMQELQRIYVERKLERLPGMGSVAAYSKVPVLPTNQARGYTLGYLSAQYGLNVVSLDAGASQTSVAWAIDGQADLCTRNSWGMAAGRQIIEEAGLDNILRWLPEECESEEALEVLLNLDLYISSVPGSHLELQISQALAREALLSVMPQARTRWRAGNVGLSRGWDLIMLSGATFIHAAHPGQAALIALDTLQPVGVSALALDALNFSSVAGVLATLEPLVATQVLDADGLMGLGSVVSLRGRAKSGDLALRVKITYEDGRALSVEVPAGSLEVIPLGPGKKATLELRPGRQFDLGESYRGRSTTVEVDGGLLGVLIDARGRPLPTRSDIAASQAAMRQALLDVGA